MSGAYLRSNEIERTAEQKPAVGSAWKVSKETRAELKAHERREMDAAKVRDERKCRVPRCEYMPQKPRLNACHKRDEHRGMGNKSAERTERKKLITCCFIHHRAYDANDLVIEPLDAELIFDGPCAFYERIKGTLQHIGTEKVIGVSTERSVR